MSKVRRKATFYAHSLHVLIQLNAAAFVKFLAFPMQRLFEGVYSFIHFSYKSLTTVTGNRL